MIKQYDCFKQAHISKKSGRLSPAGPEVLTFRSHCSAKFQPILDCLIPNFKLKYEDSENMKTDGVDTVVFNLHHIKQRNVLGDTRYIAQFCSTELEFPAVAKKGTEYTFNPINTGGRCFPHKFCLPVDNFFSFGSIATKFGDFSNWVLAKFSISKIKNRRFLVAMVTNLSRVVFCQNQ